MLDGIFGVKTFTTKAKVLNKMVYTRRESPWEWINVTFYKGAIWEIEVIGIYAEIRRKGVRIMIPKEEVERIFGELNDERRV